MKQPSDYLIVGGGLAGGMIALAVRNCRPTATVTVIDQGDRPGGNHTWAFHALDVPESANLFVRPLIAVEWPSYQVRFPGYERDVRSHYSAVTVDRFASALDMCGCNLIMGVKAVTVTADCVDLADGSSLHGRCVIDARGPQSRPPTHGRGFQKFVGLEVETNSPWTHVTPMVMDSTVPQNDGYRFMYTLPLAPTRVLVEDTYFSDSPHLDRVTLRGRVTDYLLAAGVHSWHVVREESGVLPMPWVVETADVDSAGPLAVGYAGGWFHPATGYSFPLAVRLALAIAAVSPEQARAAAAKLARRLRLRLRFARFLNRLLFTAVTPDQRWQVFRRLYRSLPDSLLARFYALEFNAVDAGRLLVGWPPPLSPSRLFLRPEVLPFPISTP